MAMKDNGTGESLSHSCNENAGAPFELTFDPDGPLPILVAVPHAGRAYTDALRTGMRQFADSSLRLEDRYVDRVAKLVAKETSAASLIAHAPRAMIDLNRSAEDMDWSMVRGAKAARPARSVTNRYARGGLGLVPRRLPGLGEIWRTPLTQAEVENRISQVHRPYHAALGRTLESLRDRWGAALLIDLHSMPPLRKRHPDDQPAEFVIGDRFGASCDPYLSDLALRLFGERGRAVAHNRPYAGGYVLDRHGAPRRGIHALQLEVCRSTYLDARLAEPSARLGKVARLISELVRSLAHETAMMGRDRQLPIAAE